MTTEPRRPQRLRYHVWLSDEYVGEVEIRNVDQLVAENQARHVGVRDVKAQPFHLTNLWLHAACVRLELTSEKFAPFTQLLDYEPAKDEDDDEAGPDPTRGPQAPSSDSA